MKLVLASGNAGKLVELRELLGDGRFALHAQSEFGVQDAEETGLTFIENALLKARHAAAATGLPALGDDSGLCVDALDGAPGLYSARYAMRHDAARAANPVESRRMQDAANVDKLLAAMAGVAPARRGARFVCVLALLRRADDPQPLVVEAEWTGTLLEAPRGTGGFGYDPVFFDPVNGCSAAELDPAVKNCIGHRGQALAMLQRRLHDHWR